MNKFLVPLSFMLLLAITQCNKKEKKTDPHQAEKALINKVFNRAEKQYTLLIDKIDTLQPLLQPRSLNKDGTLRMAVKEDWTSGFFPGSLWYLYEFTHKDEWKNRAERYTEALDSAQFVKWNHDVGFMIQNSFGNGYRLTGNKRYRQAVIDAAHSLSTRFRPVAGVIQSWDADAPWIADKHWQIPVIIDNMMNLNLLYVASDFENNPDFSKIANSHALKTMHNQYRDDYSCYHVVDYDSITGKVRAKVNFQGYADNSSWARGQAWGLYGFTEVYRYTKEKDFLDQAVHIAKFIIDSKKIPEDGIPYWDYDDAKIPNVPRDASAAAITASALLELSEFSPENSKMFVDYAAKILKTLASDDYLAKEGSNGGFLLEHSVGNIHENNETDAPLNYADYYFLEALLRWQKTFN